MLSCSLEMILMRLLNKSLIENEVVICASARMHASDCHQDKSADFRPRLEETQDPTL